MQGLFGGRGQRWRTIAGMVGVITAALFASAVGLTGALLSDHSLAVALIAGGIAFAVLIVGLRRAQGAAWRKASSTHLPVN